MKRLFTISFIALALVVGAAGAAPAAHADDIECTLNNSGTSCAVDGVSGICSGDENSGPYCRVTGTSDSTSNSQVSREVDQAAAKAVAGGLPKDLEDSEGFGKIMIWIMNLFAWLVGVAALTLDYAVYYTVITMGDYVNHLSAIGVTWQIMRDIGNIVIIFGFLAIGICTILDVKWYGGGTSMLPKLLLAAVFLNFSLFMTEAIIDTGNLFATQFYTQIKGGQMPTQATLSQTTIENGGISGKIMSQLGLQTIYGEVKNTQRAKEILAKGNSWIIGFMGIILFLITAFVMFSLAFVLIARFVILLFLIIIAPIGFAGLAIPNLSGLAKKWWDKLVEQTITAPVLLLCLYIALAVITDAQFLTGFGGARDSSGFWLGFITNGNLQGFASVMLSFLVAMGLLVAVVIISKKLSAFGADKASQFAGKLTFGATAFAGRRTLGRVSNFAARTIKSSRLGATTYGRALANVADRGAKASFDVRGVKALGGLGALGVDAGKAQEGGYRGGVEKAAKARDDYAKTLSQNQEAQRDAHRYQAWNLQQQNPALAQVAPLQRQYHAAMAQGQLAQAAQLQNQINAVAAQAQIPQNVLAQLDTAIQGDIQTTQTIQNMQIQYADSLNNWWSRNVHTTGSAARNEAARQVRNRLTTTPQQRLLQQLQAALNPPAPVAPANPPAGQPPPAQASSIRFKEGVRKLSSGIATVMSLQPVAYHYKDIPSLDLTSDREHIGFIAEEALEVEPRLVELGTDGKAKAFNYQEYTAVLTNAIQEQQVAIDGLREEIAILKQEPQ